MVPTPSCFVPALESESGDRLAARNRAKGNFDANGRKDVLMPRMCNVSTRASFVFLVLVLVTAWPRRGAI